LASKGGIGDHERYEAKACHPRLEVANGPARGRSHHLLCDVLLQIGSFGRSFVSLSAGRIAAASALRTGKPLEPWQAEVVDTAVLLVSLIIIILPLLYIVVPRASGSQPFSQSIEMTEGDLEMGNLAGDPSPAEDGNMGVPGPPVEDKTFTRFACPSYMQPAGIPSWMHLRQKSRQVVQYQGAGQTCDQAFLGDVEEGTEIAAGFGGTVRLGTPKDHCVDQVVTFHTFSRTCIFFLLTLSLL
jgi:hypothetical protein